jgi:hypothetical protein
MNTNRVVVKLSYNAHVLVDVEHLPALMGILQGATVVDSEYIEGEMVYYVKNDVYNISLEDTGNRLYKTEEQVRQMQDDAEARKRIEEEKVPEEVA